MRAPFPVSFARWSGTAGPGCHVCGAARPGTGGSSAPPAGAAGNRPGAGGRERRKEGGRRRKNRALPASASAHRAGQQARGNAADRGGHRVQPGSLGPTQRTFGPTDKGVWGGAGRRSLFFSFFLREKPFAFKGRGHWSLRKRPEKCER